MAEQFLDFPQVPTWLRRIVAAEWRNPWAVISPTPRALQAARSRKLNAWFENGAPASRGYRWVRERGRRARQAVPVLESFWPPPVPVQLLYPTSRHLAPQVRAAVEPLMDRFTV